MIHLSSTTNLVFKYFLIGCRLEYLGNFDISVAILLSSGVRTEVEALVSLMATYARAQHQTDIHLQLLWPPLGWLIVFYPLIVWHPHSATPKKSLAQEHAHGRSKYRDETKMMLINTMLIELSFHSMGLFVGNCWLVGLHTQSIIIFHLWCMLRGSVYTV